MRKALLLIGLCLLLSASLLGQTFGTITGAVRDPSGAVVPNANVTVVNTSTNAVRNTTTNTEGIYAFPALVPGPYEVRVETAGFRTATSRLELQVQQTARVDVSLQVGQTSESIEVSASAALLTTDNATVGSVIEERRIVELPLNGRNYLQLVALSPNVATGFGTPGQAGGRQGGTRSNQNIAVSGMRGVWNNYTLDGIANTDINFNLYIVMPSVDALQEFKVQSGIYPAEFGRSATQINVSTKPGTNEFHGTAYWFHRNSALDAKPYDFDGTFPANPPFRWNQYGGTIGGRLIRDKLFGMFNFEGFKERVSGTGYWTMPPPVMRNGDFSLSPIATIKNPFTLQPFPGKQLPSSMFDKTALKLLEFYPEPNLATAKIDRNYMRSTRNATDKDQLTTRVDFNESTGSQWFGRYSWNDESQLTEGLPLSGQTLISRAKQYMASNTRVISATKVNEARFGVSVMYNEMGNELGGVRNVVKELGLPMGTEPPSSWGIPTITLQSPYSGFGNNVNGPFVIDDKIYQATDNFSWIHGKHSLRFGGEYRYDIYDQIGNEFPRGRFAHDGRYTGDGFADFMLGTLSRAETAVALAQAKYRANNYAAYIDDVFRVSPKLTVNVGLRWEFFQPYYDKGQTAINSIHPILSNIPNDPNMASHPTAVRVGDGDFYQDWPFRFLTDLRSLGMGSAVPIQYARDSKLFGKRLVYNDFNNWAPRLGIAYSPNEDWSFRTGFGIFYSAESGNSRFDMNRGGSGKLDRVASSAGEQPNTTWYNFLDVSQLPVKIGSPSIWGVVPEIGTTYSMMYLLNIQRTLSKNSSLEVGYNGAQHRKVQMLQNRNAPLPGTANILNRRPYPEYGFAQVVVGGGYGNYGGLGTKYTYRLQSGLSLNLSYTWSKAMDNSSAIRGTSGDIIPQDNRCLDCEYGFSAYNIPHRLVASTLIPLPFGKGQPLLNQGGIVNQIAGGWQVGTIMTIQSGSVINTAAGYDAPGTGAWGDPRGNTNGKNPYLPKSQRTTNMWYDVTAWYYTAPGTFGNIARNRLIGPSRFNWDFSVLKNFPTFEGQNLQFRFEAFNFPNHPNWGAPGSSWGRNAAAPEVGFGRIRSTGTMRQLQFGLKYNF
ncbi:MAG: carboxypeptidase regulatory-like domain-containing protein [Bryobacterales bacterium]|nr:carboxypeptidase regulatory-like domain-containing protein [Bryobacterales bacterium]